MSDTIIYHGNCFDGYTAMWAALKCFPDAEVHAGKYGEPPPDVTGRDVVIVDFSYPRDVLLKMRDQAWSLRVLDHHKTAEADLRGLDFCTFDMDRSGAGLACDELVRRPRIDFIDIIEDRDLWRFRLPQTKHAMAYIAACEFSLCGWESLSLKTADELAAFGAPIQLYIDQYGAKACAEARWERVGGYSMPTMNLPYMNCSEHVGMLLEEHPDSPVAAGYFRRADGKWQFSLRSRADFDCSAIARAFGGGGHAQAAGFHVDRLPWEAAP